MSSAIRIPVSSAEYLKVTVTADVSLSAQAVSIAVIPARTRPETGDWISATWMGSAGTTRNAAILIGPGTSNVYPLGTYDVWVKVGDTPEIPTDDAGRLTIY